MERQEQLHKTLGENVVISGNPVEGHSYVVISPERLGPLLADLKKEGATIAFAHAHTYLSEVDAVTSTRLDTLRFQGALFKTGRGITDSLMPPQQLMERLAELGVDLYFCSEHDYEASNLFDRAAEETGVAVIPGFELTTIGGHFLVYGVKLSEAEIKYYHSQLLYIDKDATGQDLPKEEVLATFNRNLLGFVLEIEQRGGKVISAHPYDKLDPYLGNMSLPTEMYNRSVGMNPLFDVHGGRKLDPPFVISGADAHIPGVIEEGPFMTFWGLDPEKPIMEQLAEGELEVLHIIVEPKKDKIFTPTFYRGLQALKIQAVYNGGGKMDMLAVGMAVLQAGVDKVVDETISIPPALFKAIVRVLAERVRTLPNITSKNVSLGKAVQKR